jgi:hypothetical protein
VLAGKRRDLADQSAMPAERELGLEACLPGLQAQFFELADRVRGEAFAREIGERATAPLRQAVPQHPRGCRMLAARERVPAAA